MSDLNDLIPADSPLYLLYALGINDAGEIVGFALEKSTGDVHAYVATPRHVEDGSESAAPTAQGVTSESGQVALPENVRMLLQQRRPSAGSEPAKSVLVNRSIVVVTRPQVRGTGSTGHSGVRSGWPRGVVLGCGGWQSDSD